MSVHLYNRVLRLIDGCWLLNIPHGYHTSYTILREQLSKEKAEEKYNFLCSLEKESDIAKELCRIFYDKELNKFFENREKIINEVIDEKVKNGYLIN
jgi:hypothetical protein